jgi:hypothetical protein
MTPGGKPRRGAHNGLAWNGPSRASIIYSARKVITLIVKVANAGGAHMILVVFTLSSLLSA